MNNLAKQAFTLIELLVVIAIIGILSGLIVVSMSGVTQKANIAKAQVFSNSLRNSLMSNLVSEWKFDEGSGSTTVDSWGNSIGTLTGTNHLPTWKTEAECIYNSCIQFDSSEDYVSAGAVNVSGDYSIEAWVKMDSAAGGANRILFRNDAGYPRFLLSAGATNKPLIYLNATNYRYGSNNYVDGKWHHWYFVVAGSGINDISNGKIYVDAKEEVYTTTLAATDPIVPAGNISIGLVSYSLIDNVRIYDVIMSTSQIQEEYYAGLNKLVANGSINLNEYRQKLEEISLNK